MKTSSIVIIVIFTVLVVGFGLAVFAEERTACTLMGCPCDLNPGISELPCNACSSEKTIFSTGLINIKKMRPEREVILCQNDQQVGSRFDLEGPSRYTVSLFGFDLRLRP